jgi:hypothetical protein
MNPMYPIERPDFTAYMITIADDTRASRARHTESPRRPGALRRLHSTVVRILDSRSSRTRSGQGPLLAS